MLVESRIIDRARRKTKNRIRKLQVQPIYTKTIGKLQNKYQRFLTFLITIVG